jgi:hypothetical protein
MKTAIYRSPEKSNPIKDSIYLGAEGISDFSFADYREVKTLVKYFH